MGILYYNNTAKHFQKISNCINIYCIQTYKWLGFSYTNNWSKTEPSTYIFNILKYQGQWFRIKYY